MNQPPLEIDDLAAVIRESMAAQHNDHPPKRVPQTVSNEDGPPQLKLQPDFQPRTDHRYHINDLLRYHDRVFVQAAYRAVLKRSPGEAELLRDLTQLRSGAVNKIDLLAALRFSPEGRGKGVELDGLMLPALIRRLGRLPLLGYAFRLGVAFVRLPKSVRDQREFDGYVLAQNQQIADFINTLANEIQHRQENYFDDVKERIETLRKDEAEQMAALRFRIGDATDPDLDTLYVGLEDTFRGSREEIKKHFREYLPYVKDNSPVIDLGCGRGEWLELLAENGVEARGVDNNRIQVEKCRARGLDVTEQDVFAYLQSLADATIGAVTGFHIVEHMSFNALIALLNNAMRVLRPGGVVIFETPNPNNIVVGANYFYLDPTHRHPLPTELMEFVFKNRGFEKVEIIPLHPWHSGRVAGEGELAERFNGYFYGPMDYAIVGRKVGA